MISALLLPLLFASEPGHPAVATPADPPIQIWINNDGRFLRGDRAKVHVRAEEDGYLVVLHADTEGHLRVLFPIDPRDDNFVRGGKKYEVEGRGGRDAFDVGDRSGRGSIYAAVSRAPFRFDDYVLSDHWDYRALEPNRLAEDPEPELTDLVRRMAQGSFDYDVMGYYVVDRVVYANDYSYSRPYYDDFYYGGFGCGYYGCGSGLSINLSFGRPFYNRHYYGPYRYAYDPFYDPFFYDPWYYRSHYHYRPYYYRPAYYSPYRYWAYPYHNRTWNRSYTPYRFRDRALANADFRDRRYTFGRAVNTVVTRPIGKFAETDGNSSPMRRAVDRQALGDRETVATPNADRIGRRDSDRANTATSDARPRRVGEQRNESKTIEARRARPRESTPVTSDSRGRRDDMPVDVSPRRSSDDRPATETVRTRDPRSSDSEPRTERRSEAPPAEARPSRRSEAPPAEARPSRRSESPPPQSRPAPRSSERGARSSGNDGGGRRVERAPSPPPSASWSGGGGDGGRRSAGGGGGSSSGGGGGGRRR
jgi:hypothetical protein